MEPEVEAFLGWQSQPNVRGTIEIIYGCVATIGLCSWSCLCLNIPSPDTTTAGAFLNRFCWQIFTIVFPEVTVAIAAEQWESANQGVEKFRELGYDPSVWTRRHAFFADMGGVHLQTPGFPPFPVDSQQLAYLVEHRYLGMPHIAERDIRDKNKADGVARALALAQIVWFMLQCLGRWVQRIGLSTLELSTLAFICCTLNVYFFWYFKPFEVQSPVVLPTSRTIQDILLEAGDKARRPYSRTPLDFIKPPPDDRSITAPFWFGVDSIVRIPEDPGFRPVRYFANNKTMPPNGITSRERLYGIVVEYTFFGLHFLGLLLEFPSRLERLLWFVSSVSLVFLLTLYLVAIYAGHKYCARASVWLFQKEAQSIQEIVQMLPRWVSAGLHGTVLFFYVLARIYILVEGFVGLRALPAKLYTTVAWTDFIPHI